MNVIITHTPVHINDLRDVRATHMKRTGKSSSDSNAQVKGQAIVTTCF